MVKRGGPKHETEIKARCFKDNGDPFKPKFDEWFAFADPEQVRLPASDPAPAESAAAAEAAAAAAEAAAAPVSIGGGAVPDLWLAFAARFEAVGGLRTSEIFRVSADNGKLDDGERELFDVSKNEEICSKNKELCIKNEELCIKNKEFCIKNDEFCSQQRTRTRMLPKQRPRLEL